MVNNTTFMTIIITVVLGMLSAMAIVVSVLSNRMGDILAAIHQLDSRLTTQMDHLSGDMNNLLQRVIRLEERSGGGGGGRGVVDLTGGPVPSAPEPEPASSRRNA